MLKGWLQSDFVPDSRLQAPANVADDGDAGAEPAVHSTDTESPPGLLSGGGGLQPAVGTPAGDHTTPVAGLQKVRSSGSGSRSGRGAVDVFFDVSPSPRAVRNVVGLPAARPPSKMSLSSGPLRELSIVGEMSEGTALTSFLDYCAVL